MVYCENMNAVRIWRLSIVTVPFLTALLLGQLLSDMVRVVDCHAGFLGSNPGGPRYFPLGITSLVAAVARTYPTAATSEVIRCWVNSLETWLEWSTVTQEFWVRILADPDISPWNYFTAGGSGNSGAPESASGSGSGIP